MNIIFSNRWEKMADALARRLFAPPPFARRIVLVPSDAVREFLLFHFAKTLGIAAGVKICSLEKGIAELVQGKKRIPPFIELSLAIEAQLRSAQDDPLFAPVCDYVVADKEQRIGALSDQLARHFMRYGLHGAHFLKKWLSEGGWQQQLWRAVFAPGSPLTYPLEALQDKAIDGREVHLFGFPALADPYLRFFANGGAYFYHFSVCAEYWEDICSDRERLAIDRRLTAKGASLLLREEMQHYLEERHPLLANWGKFGREGMKAEGAYDFEGVEWYEPPSGQTLLGALQQSLLWMQEIIPVKENRSIQLHSAPSKQREVEVMRDVLLTLFDEHAKRGEALLLSDILVFAPDIRAYAPYIHTVLDAAGLAHAIDGLKIGSLSPCAQGFFHLLSLADDELSAQGMLKLFSYAPFCKRWDFCPEDVERIGEWLKSARVRSGKQSWEEGLDRLVLGVAMLSEETVSCVAQTEVELLNTFYVCLQSVQKSLEEMRCAEEKRLDEWLEWARALLLTHFDCDDEEPLLREMEGLQRRAAAGVFPFVTLLRVLRHFFEKESGTLSSAHLHKIRCSSLKSGAARPARIVYLLGMDEESFPRQDVTNSLCALPRPLPAKADEDRYLFLELLVSAKDYFLMSYQRNDRAPSILVEELMTYLKGAPLTLHHPLFAFDPLYFSRESVVRNYTEYDLAKAHASRKPEERAFFSWKAAHREEAPLRIRSLRTLARHPLEFYFKERHGIYLQRQDEVDEAFCLSRKEQYALKRTSLMHSLAQAACQGQARGVLPEGLFKEVALDALGEDVQEQERCMRALGVQGSDLFSIELSAQCREPMRLREGGWVVPALNVRGVPIVGTLDDVTPRGLLVHAEQGIEGVLTAWPLYLIFLLVKDQCEEIGSELLFAKDGEKRALKEDALPLLEGYVDYALRAVDEPSPLLPKWASRLLKGEKEAFCALVAKEPFHSDPYLEWMQMPEPGDWYERWASYLQEKMRWILTF